MPIKDRPNSAPSVSIIGPGRLGQAMAISLARSGYAIKALVARRRAKAEKAAISLGLPGKRIQALSFDRLAEMEPTDLILIATPDDAIAIVVQQLATVKGGAPAKRVVLHTSGALSSEVLSPLAKIGFHTGSLHPLVSVSDPVSGSQALRGAFFCVEGDNSAARVARRVVRDLGGKSFELEATMKPLYHAAALTAAGQLTALVDLAMDMLVSCGLKRHEAQKVLMPLVESAVNNLKVTLPENALTGTFARGDVATVRRHLEAMSGKDQTEALSIYKLLGLRSLRLAQKKGVDAKVLKQIEKLLK